MLSRRGAYVLFALLLAVLGGYVLYPSLRLFATGLDAERLRALFGTAASANVRALVNSVLISLYSVGGAGVLGTGLAWTFYRYDVPLRRPLMALAALPLALPPLVGVLAFLFLYGESGILPRGLQHLLGLEAVPFALEGLGAVWVVHVYSLYVYFYLFVLAALRGLDGSLLEASADLGAGAWTTFRRVVLPALRPALGGAALLVFMVSMASFTAPLLFAGTEPFLTLQIYNYKTNGDLEASASVAVVLTTICLLFLAGLEATGRPQEGAAGAGKGAAAPPQPVGRGRARLLAGAASALLVLFLLLPIATIVLLSFAQEGSWTYQVLPTRYTLANYAALAADPAVLAPVLNSLQMAALATAACLVVGLGVGLLAVKSRVRGRGLLRGLAVLPFAIPGTVVAVNLLVAFNTPTPLAFGQVLVGSFWILPLAYFVRHLPFVARASIAAFERFDDRLAEASADLGAGFATTFRRVVLPLVGPGVLAGTLLAFVTALGEFVASILLYTVSNRPISVQILSELRLYDFGAAAAYSVLLMGLIAAATLAVRHLGPDVAP